MLPFFRKIRWRLAKDNQFLKYSRYAIGEILLIVVGIMIALQINNWNEENKENELLLSNLHDMRNDLIRDTLGFNNYLEFLDQSSRFKEILLMQNSFDQFTLDSLIVLIQPFTNVNEINTKSYEKIDWSAVKKEDKLDSLVSSIENYYIAIKSRHDGFMEWDITFGWKESEYWYYNDNFELSYLESVNKHYPYLKSDAERLSDLKKELATIKVRNLIRMSIYRANWMKRGVSRSKSEAATLIALIDDYLITSKMD